MKIKLRLAAVLFILLSFITTAYAQPCRTQNISVNTPATGICAPWVNLTPAQQTQITGIYNELTSQTAAMQKQIQKKRLMLKTLLLEDKIDSKKVLDIQKEVSDLSSEIEMKTLENMIRAYNLLTIEQRDQLPAGCTLGFGNMNCSRGPCNFNGRGYGGCYNKGMGRGSRQGHCW